MLNGQIYPSDIHFTKHYTHNLRILNKLVKGLTVKRCYIVVGKVINRIETSCVLLLSNMQILTENLVMLFEFHQIDMGGGGGGFPHIVSGALGKAFFGLDSSFELNFFELLFQLSSTIFFI